MTRSSGQLVTTTTRDVECDGISGRTFLAGTPLEYSVAWPCTFEGNVDVTVDPETMWAGWVCDSCGTQHDIDWDQFVGGGV